MACLAALSASGANHKRLGKSRNSISTPKRSKSGVIERFVEGLRGIFRPVLVGFNSGGFRPSSAIGPWHSASKRPLHGTNGRNYWYRFGRDHVDLCDVLSNYAASAKPSLAEAAALIGISAKSGGMNGSQIEAYINTGRAQEVANYCETDLVSTYLLYLRWQLATGELNETMHARSVNALHAFIDHKISSRPHLLPFANSRDQIMLDPGGIAGEIGTDLGTQAVTTADPAAQSPEAVVFIFIPSSRNEIEFQVRS